MVIREISLPITEQQLLPLEDECGALLFTEELSIADHKVLAKLLSTRPDVKLRILPFHKPFENLDFLQFYPFLKRVEIKAYHLQNINGLRYLKHLEEIVLGETKFSNHPLDFLIEINSLESITIEKQKNVTKILPKLKSIKKLSLRSITLNDLDFLKLMPDVWSIEIKLGSCKDVSGLGYAKNLKYLYLWQVRGLENLEVLGRLSSLQFLSLSSMPKIHKLPQLNNLAMLRRVTFESMKGIKSFSPIAAAPQLEDFIFISAIQCSPDDFNDLINHPKIKFLAVGFGTNLKNSIFEKKCLEANLNRSKLEPFVFV